MAPDREYRIEQAIDSVQKGQSTRLAALDWFIPESTLRHRLLGTVTIREAKEATQRLSRDQGIFVKDWILHEETCGRAPSPLQVRSFANRILKEGAAPGEDVPTVGTS